MRKTKIIITAALTTVFVGVINSASAFIAYSLLVPGEEDEVQTLIVDGATEELPEPDQAEPIAKNNDSSINTSKSSSGGQVQLRKSDDQLVAGQKPKPSAVIEKDGKKVYQWCSGTNPNLPDEVCQAVISIVSSPSGSNPHLGPKAKESLSLLPADSTLKMDEKSWKATGGGKGEMFVDAKTTEYGRVRLKIFLEKQGNIWVVTDGQLA